ncbi:Dipeptide ABC transporter dipeptide-binding domain containing protein [Halorhabdus tiamatea SARL4B]|uniref:Dipeptide ABC transporter dipeptide-binding domain containing protein n=1 Tax=Halorhabdus tiamatea SARL4B TaxID=1033806 RepID=S6D2U8_9EURY|nr:ABC transporter substrate-binding protein [Halorhabdus tiamatea]ERJ05456.1 Dipeptide ABC transporter dipeptide-binding domain containing protein [Halorhabdus tiamatea SARL4B]CCQ33570.1 dipeptide ABC transporter dipeptide-binding protein [Halorhabdus tiamatea SARL4B]
MPRDTTRRGFLTAAGAGAMTAVAGCGANSEPTDQDTPAQNDPGDESAEETPESTVDTDHSTEEATTHSGGGTLQMMADGSVQTLDPINAKGSGAGYNQYNQQLMYFPDGHYPPEPALATGYEVSEDGLTYTFDLREDVTFHDGSEFTAQDVVYSYRRLAESPNSRNKDDIVGETLTIDHEKDATLSEPTDEETLEDVVPGSLAVEAVDDYTVEVTLASPFEYTLFQIAGGAFAILPENAVGDIEGYDGEYDYNEFFSTQGGGPAFAGAGPFRVDSWQKGSQITLSAFEDYYGGEPDLDAITFTVVSSGNTRLQRFQNGNADILESVPTASFNPSRVTIDREEGNRSLGSYTLDDGTEVNYGEIPALTTEYIVFNTLAVPLPVRRAFAYAMNQHDIAENVYKGMGKPGYHIVPPAAYPTFEDGQSGEDAYDRHAENGYESNTDFAADGYPYGYGETQLDDARRVMEEAGYDAGNRYEVTATTITGDSGYEQVFTRLQAKLRSAYIDVEIEEAEFGTIISRAISGDMEVFGLGDGMEYPGPQNFLRFLHGQNPSSQFTRWGAEDSYATEEYRQIAREAWDENYAAEGTTQADHNEAFQTVEEMNWASVQELPFLHPMSQRFWHDAVDVEMYGVMENQAFDDTSLGR